MRHIYDGSLSQRDVLSHWEPTPRWHWRYWFGWTIRRRGWLIESDLARVMAYLDWEYGRPRRVARELLEQQYDT